jgi:hypothetical protein
VGVCDVDEVCSGSAPMCPADAYQPTTFRCGLAGGGGCDVDDFCTGAGPGCPNALRPMGYVCRAARNMMCDSPERCSGFDNGCPTDVYAPSTATCNPPLNYFCNMGNCCMGSTCLP